MMAAFCFIYLLVASSPEYMAWVKTSSCSHFVTTSSCICINLSAQDRDFPCSQTRLGSLKSLLARSPHGAHGMGELYQDT